MPVYAQTLRGSIGGEVTDAARKPLSSASVTLVQEETNKKRTTQTGPKGEFTVTLLAPGTYRLEVESAGYRRHVQTVLLDVNQEVRIEVPLLAGKSTEQVNVTATRGLVRTDSASV